MVGAMRWSRTEKVLYSSGVIGQSGGEQEGLTELRKRNFSTEAFDTWRNRACKQQTVTPVTPRWDHMSASAHGRAWWRRHSLSKKVAVRSAQASSGQFRIRPVPA